ncbi:MAG: hypothetical protein Q8R12_04250 [bacterium]|nr:hypothetical protein [bacterium]
MDYIRYAPEKEKLLKELHWEVWNELPTSLCKFSEAFSRDGSLALRAKRKGFYVWVTPIATRDATTNTSFLALGRRVGVKVDFVVVLASKLGLVDTAQKLNEMITQRRAGIRVNK